MLGTNVPIEQNAKVKERERDRDGEERIDWWHDIIAHVTHEIHDDDMKFKIKTKQKKQRSSEEEYTICSVHKCTHHLSRG